MDVKCLYSLYVVCFTALSVNCGDHGGGGGGGNSSASMERGAAASYEQGDDYGNSKRTLLYDEDADEVQEKIAALKTSRVGSSGSGGGVGGRGVGGGGVGGGGVKGGVGDIETAGQPQPAKRFIVPISPADLGIEVPISRPYFVHSKPPRNQHRPQQQHQQYHRQPHQQQHHHHQQQQHHHQQQNYSPGPYYHQHHQGGGDNFGFGPSSPGGHSGYNEQPENFYQPSDGGGGGGGGGENVNFDTTGFTDFAGPSSGYRGGSTSSPATDSSPPPSPFTASPPHLHGGPAFDGGSDGQQHQHQHQQHPFDPTGFGGPSGHPDFGDAGAFPDFPAHPAPVVHKSIYVHVAPPDDEPPRKQRVIMPDVPPKKNYQIVFIKAPVAPAPVAPVIPPPPQHTDKTLIYVLHPRPEEAPPIRIPAPPATLPLKPEVYFIKYKHRDEPPQHHHHGGGTDYGAGALPPPGDEFGGGGGGDTSGGYSHRRYGRGDKTSPRPPAQLALPPSSSAEASASPPQSSAESPPPQSSSAETARPSFADPESSGPAFADLSAHRSFADVSSSAFEPPLPASSVESPSPAAAAQQPTAATTAAAAADTGGLDDVDMSSERRDLSDAEETTAAPSGPRPRSSDHDDDAEDDEDGDASRESAVRELFRGGYSVEYNDASVDSSNLSESHAALSAPKGKNGH